MFRGQEKFGEFPELQRTLETRDALGEKGTEMERRAVAGSWWQSGFYSN